MSERTREICTSNCDSCHTLDEGTMFLSPDAMGIMTPVLFLCVECDPKAYEQVQEEAQDDDSCEPSEDSMDGDAESALASAGFGTSEDYGDFGSDEGCYSDFE